ncbi:hypothetical protein VP01_3062g4 [Puccinia sorghi]|uniref:Uncharacterized protein n=1 Tax=Puccinia sorghi TaxID=27349 RepID=A0A0L6V1M8_9BASI|nr:hypothetical protein VP01_3062g4 [Puccinia sorghi]
MIFLHTFVYSPVSNLLQKNQPQIPPLGLFHDFDWCWYDLYLQNFLRTNQYQEQPCLILKVRKKIAELKLKFKSKTSHTFEIFFFSVEVKVQAHSHQDLCRTCPRGLLFCVTMPRTAPSGSFGPVKKSKLLQGQEFDPKILLILLFHFVIVILMSQLHELSIHMCWENEYTFQKHLKTSSPLTNTLPHPLCRDQSTIPKIQNNLLKFRNTPLVKLCKKWAAIGLTSTMDLLHALVTLVKETMRDIYLILPDIKMCQAICIVESQTPPNGNTQRCCFAEWRNEVQTLPFFQPLCYCQSEKYEFVFAMSVDRWFGTSISVKISNGKVISYSKNF